MYELRAIVNSISRQTSSSCELSSYKSKNSTCAKNDAVKYKIINKNGTIGIYNAEDELVGRRIIKASISDSKLNALKHGITVNSETELDRLLDGFLYEEETAII
jgi:hypothetical protein